LRHTLKAELNKNQDTKEKYERRRQHTITRIHARYGLAIREEDYDQLLTRIIGGSGEIMFKEKSGFHIIVITYQSTDIELTVVYDPFDKMIRTALPPNNLTYKKFVENGRKKVKWM
jgi:hypothetical protein